MTGERHFIQFWLPTATCPCNSATVTAYLFGTAGAFHGFDQPGELIGDSGRIRFR